MAQKKGGGSRGKSGAAARADKSGKPRQITWKGLKLEGVPTLPGVLAFDMSDRMGLNDAIDVLREVLTPDSFRIVRNKVAADQVNMADVEPLVTDLFGTVFEAYGIKVGE